MRQVVLFIAMSLDGVIATPEGGVDWLGGEDAESSDSGSYERFIAGVSNVVMGYTTYHQLTTELLPGAWPYAAQSTHVLTHRSMENEAGISFTQEPVAALLARLKAQSGGEIWICGGASIVNQCIRQGLIDRFQQRDSDHSRVGDSPV